MQAKNNLRATRCKCGNIPKIACYTQKHHLRRDIICLECLHSILMKWEGGRGGVGGAAQWSLTPCSFQGGQKVLDEFRLLMISRAR